MENIMMYNVFKKRPKKAFLIKDFVKNFFLALIIAILFAFAFGYKFFNVITPSMTPTMPIGTLVIVKDIDYEKVRVGDTITYYTNTKQNYVTHRVIGFDSKTNEIITAPEVTWLKLKAENKTVTSTDQGSNYELISKSKYVGTVTMYIKGGGSFLGYFQNQENHLFIIVAVVLVLFVINFI